MATVFLGLLQGHGSIQVNHWKKQSLQFGIVIKLNYTPVRHVCCNAPKTQHYVSNLHIPHGYIIVVEDHKIKLKRIMGIIDKYGLLLTHRPICFF